MEQRSTRTENMHSLEMFSRARAALTGVKEVIAFDDTQVTLLTESGEITLTGEGLHVTRLMLDEGQLTVEGRMDGVFYTDKREKRRLRRSDK